MRIFYYATSAALTAQIEILQEQLGMVRVESVVL